jgi:hypothetical protein
MNMLNDVVIQPTNHVNYSSVQRIPTVSRAKTGTRKLGHVRTRARVSTDQNEQQLARQSLFNLNR